MDQVVVERTMEYYLLQHHNVAVQYAAEPNNIRLNNDPQDHMVVITIQQAGVSRDIQSRYVIGADGAHSWTRKQAGIEMLGARTCKQTKTSNADILN
jgi:2-polyprenyl-6-methoxyphenol hydroxylase-like FAD-dependent oxidoreductase